MQYNIEYKSSYLWTYINRDNSYIVVMCNSYNWTNENPQKSNNLNLNFKVSPKSLSDNGILKKEKDIKKNHS